MRKWLFIILLIVFLAPGVLAYFFYATPWLFTKTTLNRGKLITPPKSMTEFSPKSQKWRLILWNFAECDQQCLHKLEDLMRVRLALGRKLYDVDVCLLHVKTISLKLQNLFKAQHICDLKLSPEDVSRLKLTHSEILMVDPQNYWILSYLTNAPLDDLYQDLKRLLR